MKASVYFAVSIDGFIARLDGDVEWLHRNPPEDSDNDYGYYDLFNAVDRLILGRNTYEKVLSFGVWPYDDKRVIVMTSRPFELPEHLKGSVEVSSETPAELYQRLESDGIGHIYVDGGKTIQSFLRAGLIDEMTITTIPVLLGEGIRAFGPLEGDVFLEHLETKSFPEGLVQSHYKVDKEESGS